DELVADEAGDGRIAVDYGGKHRERVALALGVHLDARHEALGAGKARGLPLDRELAFQVGKNLGHQLEDLVGAETPPAPEDLHLAGAEVRLGEEREGIAAADHAVGEDLVDGGVLHEVEAEAVGLILQPDHQAPALRTHLDRFAVEADVALSHEQPEDRLEDLAGKPPLELGADPAVDREVLLRDGERRPFDLARDDRAERLGEGDLLALTDEDAREVQAVGRTAEAVADGGVAFCRGRDLPPLLEGAFGGNHRGGRVHAGSVRRGAFAGPIASLGVEHHQPPHALAGRENPQGDAGAGGRLPYHGLAPRELHAARPGVSRGLLAHCFEEFSNLLAHRRLPLWLPGGALASPSLGMGASVSWPRRETAVRPTKRKGKIHPRRTGFGLRLVAAPMDQPIRIVSYNVRYFGHVAKGLASTRAGKRGIARALAGLEPLPDLICLQEVETNSIRSDIGWHRTRQDETQLESFMGYLGQAFHEGGLEMPYDALYFRAHNYKLGEISLYTTGLAILVNRFTLRVEDHNADQPFGITYYRVARWKDRKQSRICAHLKVRDLGGRPFHVFNTHLSLPTPFAREYWAIKDKMGWGHNQVQEVKRLASFIRQRAGDEPFVVCGDFNSQPASPVFDIMHRESGLVAPQL